MLKITAILLNIIFLGILVWLTIDEGFGEPTGIEMLFILMVFLTPVINLLALILSKDNWITLYFKRKAMEEKKKISELENK